MWLTYIEAIDDIAQRMLRELVVVLVGHEATNAAGKALGQRQTLGQARDVANAAQKDRLTECDAREETLPHGAHCNGIAWIAFE